MIGVFLLVIGFIGLPGLHTLSCVPADGSAPPHWITPRAGIAAISERHRAQHLTLPDRRYQTLRTPDAFLWVVALVAEPFEDELSAAVTRLFKNARYGIRRGIRFLRWSANRWAQWTVRALGFFVLAVLAPLLNRDLLATWREQGRDGLRNAILLGVAVYIRLLLDRQAPVLGKLAIVLALAYGVASRDLVPDASFPLGVLDDVLAVVLASRGFMLLCPESLVEAHAMLAARARERRRVWQRSRARPPAG
jgi:uncharacterized membrane protein YkvA (DUF1232 family)